MSATKEKSKFPICEAGGSLLIAVFCLGLMSAIVLLTTQCANEVSLTVKVRERLQREQMFVHYLKNATDCRETIRRHGGCDGAPMDLYTRTGKKIPDLTQWPGFAVPVVTCIVVAPMPFPQYALSGIPSSGIPSRERFDVNNAMPSGGSYLTTSYEMTTSPDPIFNATRWNLWFSLQIEFQGLNSIPAGSKKDIYYYKLGAGPQWVHTANTWVSFAPGSKPWVCDDGYELEI